MAAVELLYFAPLLFVAAGVLFAVLFTKGRREQDAFVARAQRVPGVVTDERWQSVDRAGHGEASHALHFPVLRFELPDGRTVDAQSAWGTQLPKARTGDAVTVLYDPQDPARATVDGLLSSGRWVWGFGVAFGVVFALIGLLGCVASFLIYRALH